MGGLLKAIEFHFAHLKDLGKVAVVSNDKVFQTSIKLKDLLVPARVNSFKKSGRIKAMNWIME